MRPFFCFILLFLFGCRQQNTVMGYVDADYLYLGSEQGGKISTLLVHAGDWVNAHQPLSRFDTTLQDEGVKQALAEQTSTQALLHHAKNGQRQTIIEMSQKQLALRKSQLDYAQSFYQKMDRLYRVHAVTLDRFEHAQADFQGAKANYESAKLDLLLKTLPDEKDIVITHEQALLKAKSNRDVATWHQTESIIQSPTKGWISQIFYRPGEWVAPGHPVIEFLAPEYQYIVFFINTKALSHLKLGDELKVRYEHHNFKVHVTSIAKKAEYTPPVIYSETQKDRLVYQVKASIDPKDAAYLHPGQPVEIALS